MTQKIQLMPGAEPPKRKFLPTLPRFEPPTMDHTATQQFKKCPRMYFYRMVLGRTTPDGKWESVFAWGSAVHKFAEVLYENGDVAEAMLQGFKLFRPPTNPKFDFQNKERLTKTMLELHRFYLEEKGKGNVKVEAIEQPFNFSFPDGTIVGGRWDQLLRMNGRLYIRDWKTTSKQGQYFKAGLDPNDQAIRYIFGASVLSNGQTEDGYPNRVIDGVLFTSIYNTKTIGPQIENTISSRTITQVRQWMKEQMHWHKMMELCRIEDIWPMNEASCTYCNYRAVCTQSSEMGMEQNLNQFYLLKPWKHEEVDQQIQEL